MISDLASALRRARPTLLQDMAGGAALVVLLLASLHLPAFV